MSQDEHRRQLDDAERQALLNAVREALAPEPAVAAAWLYGSVARGQPARDIDIAVLVRPGQAGEAWAVVRRAAARLEQTLGLGLPLDMRPVDGTAAPAFRFAVIREGVLACDRDRDARRTFWAEAVRDWLDVEPMVTRLSRAFVERSRRVS